MPSLLEQLNTEINGYIYHINFTGLACKKLNSRTQHTALVKMGHCLSDRNYYHFITMTSHVMYHTNVNHGSGLLFSKGNNVRNLGS